MYVDESLNGPRDRTKLNRWLEQRGTARLTGDSPVSADFHLFELLDQCNEVSAANGLPVFTASFSKLEGGRELAVLWCCCCLKLTFFLSGFYQSMKADAKMQAYLNSDLPQLPHNNKMALYGSAPGGKRYTPGDAAPWDADAIRQ